MKEHLESFPMVIEVPLAWGEMDAFQHVNNAVYFRWFESARIAYFRHVGTLEIMERTGVGPILASTDCRFRIPLTYPDTVSVGTRVSRIGEDRFVMDYRVASHESGKVAAQGTGTIVTFDYRQKRKAPIPDEMRVHILAYEDGVGNTPEPMPPRPA
jgi:acyl-CoA thioester hydrolase